MKNKTRKYFELLLWVVLYLAIFALLSSIASCNEHVPIEWMQKDVLVGQWERNDGVVYTFNDSTVLIENEFEAFMNDKPFILTVSSEWHLSRMNGHMVIYIDFQGIVYDILAYDDTWIRTKDHIWVKQ